MLFYLCSRCPERIAMRAQFAAEHSQRTGHKVYIETAADIMERSIRPRLRSRAEIVKAVEERNTIKPFIIDSAHAQECKCKRCWDNFQKQWIKGL